MINGETYKLQGKDIDLGSLVEEEASDSIRVYGCRKAMAIFECATINTNVVLEMQHSPEESAFANINEDGSNLVVTANGRHAIVFEHCDVTGYIRVKWVSSEGSGNTPAVTCIVRLM